jgi:hypothetical protein
MRKPEMDGLIKAKLNEVIMRGDQGTFLVRCSLVVPEADHCVSLSLSLSLASVSACGAATAQLVRC